MSLYIGNLSSRTRRDELEHVFQRFGRCDVRIKDGYGFVVYEFPPNAEKALRALRKRNICGEPLTLTWSNKQPRQFNRLSRTGGSYKPQHGKDSVRREYVKGKLGSNDQDYGISVKQSDGVSRRNGFGDVHDEDMMYRDDETKDNLVVERSGYRQDFLDKGGRFEPDTGDNDRWGEQFHDQPNENGIENDIEFERYEPYQDYDRKYDDGIHQMAYHTGSPALQSPQRDSGRDNKDEANLKHLVNAKSRLTCYRCGGSGHKMRNCPQESASLRKSTRFDRRHADAINKVGSGGSEPGRFGSRSRERSSRDSLPKRLMKNNVKSSDLEKLQRSVSSVSPPAQNEIDKSWRKHRVENKRSRKESQSPKSHSAKKARGSFSSSLHSRSRSASQSFKHVKRSRSHSKSRSISSRTHSLSSKSRSSSASHYSGSKSFKSRARSSSRTSLSASVGRPLPSSSNKDHLNLKGSSDNVTTRESNAIVIEQRQLVEGGGKLEDKKHERGSMAGVNEIAVAIEMEKGQPLEKDNEDREMASSSLHEITNPSTVSVEKGTTESGNISSKGLENGSFCHENPVEMNCENSDKLITEHVPVQLKNPDSDPPISTGPGQSLGFSSDELCVVLKHYYGHDVRNENERHLPADAYFGSARLWPWEVIYYRRAKKGPISVKNYARRLEQNKEFGIVDKYIRSSSGWGELAPENH